MKRNQDENRFSIATVIVACYLLPILLLSTYSMGLMPIHYGWRLFSFGLAGGLLGSCVLFVLLCRREMALCQQMQEELPAVTSESPHPILLPENPPLPQENVFKEEWLAKEMQLLAEIEEKNQGLQTLQKDKEQFQYQKKSLIGEFETVKKVLQEQLLHHEALLKESQKEYQQTIMEKQSVIEQQQQRILILESKEYDLTYEIKTLLQLVNIESPTVPPIYESSIDSTPHMLHEPSTPYDSKSEDGFEVPHHPPYAYQDSSEDLMDLPLNRSILQESKTGIHTSEIAKNQLKRCLDIAAKMTGAHHLGNNARYGDLPVDNYALDLRRLFDNLRVENSCIVLFYSQKENKLLFVNNQAKNILGWSPEKFVQDFPILIQKGMEEWKAGIAQLLSQPETQILLPIKTKMGTELPLHCNLGIINTGMFRQHIMGVLYE